MNNLHPLFISIILLFGPASPLLAQDRPNIVLIMADDMNQYGFLGSDKQVKTPNLDAFREKAITFHQAYCPAPACSPSRTAFLSGLSPHKTGKYYNGSKAWETGIMKEQETMLEWFQRAGYATYGYGKLFHSDISKDRVARNFPNGTGKAGFGPFPDAEHRTFGSDSRFRGIQAFPDEDFPDVQNADAIIDLLEQDQEKPFFLMYGLWRPHSPYTCPQRFLDMYDVNDIEIPPGYLKNDIDDMPPIPKAYIESKGQQGEFNEIVSSEQKWKEYLKGYFASYSFADYNIGRVLEALESSQFAKNTIIIVTSDNGFHMGEKDRFDKNSLWEQSAITPMVIYMPGSPQAGKICAAPVNLLDLYPTFVDFGANGINPRNPIDGHSIRPLLEDLNTNWEHPSITYFGKNWVSIRSEKYRYITYPDGGEELYDHTRDPWELNNLAGLKKYRKVKSQLKKHVPDQMLEAIPGRWTKMINGIVTGVTETE